MGAALATAILAPAASCFTYAGVTDQERLCPVVKHRESILNVLQPALSSEAAIYLPGSPEFKNATDRWQVWAAPNFSVIVQVAETADVQASIRWANENGLPFQAISGGHGGTTAMGELRDGVGIYMREMKNITVTERSDIAMIQGGALSGEVSNLLWGLGKQTVTGGCECTGMIAPLLGGGHGWLQGQYGLAADNLISAQLVIANGSAIDVSATSHSDLFWGLRGAGHNFGIVTNMEYKVYDRTPELDTWNVETFTFTSTQVKDVFREANKLVEPEGFDRPKELTHWITWLRNPAIDAVNALITIRVMYQSLSGVPSRFSLPFHQLHPLSHTTETTDLPGLARMMSWTLDGLACTEGNRVQRFPLGAKRYPIEGGQAAMEIFESLPSRLAPAQVYFEGYSVEGVQNVPDESTAFPDRENDLLIAPVVRFDTANLTAAEIAEFDRLVTTSGNAIREALLEDGRELTSYVNYAQGEEGPKAFYGHEPWRQERLRRLKREWDPEGRFSFYAPIEEL